MQPCNRIYYSIVHWRLNMFRAAHRSSSGALTVCAASGLHTQFPLRLDYGRSPHAYVNQRLQIQLELLIMSVVPLETCWAFNERWNNKFYYKVASCWLFLLSHTTMHGSMNIKYIILPFCPPGCLSMWIRPKFDFCTIRCRSFTTKMSLMKSEFRKNLVIYSHFLLKSENTSTNIILIFRGRFGKTLQRKLPCHIR